MSERKRHPKTITSDEATTIVERLKTEMSVDVLATLLDMSKMTLYVRLKTKDWRLAERILIEKYNKQ